MILTEPRKHLFIPDPQVKPGVPLYHLKWCSKYIVDIQPDVIICAGDFADMPSLSAWDRGTINMEGRRYSKDIDSVCQAWEILNSEIEYYNYKRRRNKEKQYKPLKIITLGNHEHRIVRAYEKNPELFGAISLSDLPYSTYGWEVSPFLSVVEVDGIWYSHYFYNPRTSQPWGGMIDTRIKNIGHSFTQGHVQGKMVGEIQRADGRVDRGLVAGSFYLHDELYIGPQGNNEWRGLIVKHEVNRGQYDLMEVSMDYLCRTYQGCSLEEFKQQLQHYPAMNPSTEVARY